MNRPKTCFSLVTNAEGNVQDFEIELTDFQKHPLDPLTTVGELYEVTKLPILRFYLATTKKAGCSGNQLAASPNPPRPSVPLAEGQEPTDVVYVSSSNVLSDTNGDHEPFDCSTM